MKWNGLVNVWDVNAKACSKEDEIIVRSYDACCSSTNKGLLHIACKLLIAHAFFSYYNK